GLQPLNEAAVTKDFGTRYEQDLPVIARQLFPAEPELAAVDTYGSMLARATMNAPRLSIQGRTREILRGIIARGLGLGCRRQRCAMRPACCWRAWVGCSRITAPSRLLMRRKPAPSL